MGTQVRRRVGEGCVPVPRWPAVPGLHRAGRFGLGSLPARAAAVSLLVAVLAAATGCGRSAGNYERYVPSAQQAQQALTSVLQLWREGEPVGLRTLHGVGEVYVIDSQWQQGRPLRSFAVLGEAPGDGPRTLAARLVLDNPRQETIVRYYLVGVKPLWIFRQEDYDMISHWDHPHASAQNTVPAERGSVR